MTVKIGCDLDESSKTYLQAYLETLMELEAPIDGFHMLAMAKAIQTLSSEKESDKSEDVRSMGCDR